MTKSSGGGVQQVIVPPPTAQETALQEKQIALAEAQLEAIGQMNDFQQQQFALAAPIFEKQAKLLEAALGDIENPETIARLEKVRAAQDELLDLELENIRRGGAATEEEKRLIGETVAQGIAAGESDITKFQGDVTERLAQELAPALGLRPTDTPIVDRAGRAAEEATRQQGQLVRNLRGAEATARLNFPLARSQVLSAATQFQQSLAESQRQFSEGLRESALTNRLNLAGGAVGQAGQFGLGLATGIPGNPGALAAALGSQRVAGAPRISTTTSAPSALQSIGGIASGVGALATGFFSSKELKTDKQPVDALKALEVVERLPVESWRYHGEDILHLGPYAEDFHKEVGTGDGVSISIIDHLGLLTAALKGLAKKVDNDNPLNLKAA